MRLLLLVVTTSWLVVSGITSPLSEFCKQCKECNDVLDRPQKGAF